MGIAITFAILAIGGMILFGYLLIVGLDYIRDICPGSSTLAIVIRIIIVVVFVTLFCLQIYIIMRNAGMI